MRVDWDRVRVVVNSAGRLRCEPGWSMPPQWVHKLRDFDLWFVWAGRGRMILKDRRIVLRPGVCIWARPGRYYEASQEGDRLGVSHIHFDLMDAQNPSRRVADPLPPEVHDLQDVALVDAIMRRIVELYREAPLRGAQQQRAAMRAATSLMTSVLMDIDHRSSSQTSLSGTQRRHRQLALEVASWIDETPGESIDIERLARRAGYSTGHFTRVFKSVLGQSPQTYAVNARVNRARQLLRESGLSVGQIAMALGYEDVFFFSRQFKQKTGQTPRSYRRGSYDEPSPLGVIP